MKTKLILLGIITVNACVWGGMMWRLASWQLGLMIFVVAFVVTTLVVGLWAGKEE